MKLSGTFVRRASRDDQDLEIAVSTRWDAKFIGSSFTARRISGD